MTQDEINSIARAEGLIYIPQANSPLVRIVRKAIEKEREACAQVAEGFPANRDWVKGSLWGNIRKEVATEIRARGQKEGA